MKEKNNLLQTLLARGKKAATKVDRRAKKPFRTIARAQGVPKKTVKAALKGPKAPPKAAKAAVGEIRNKEKDTEESKGFSVKSAVALAQRLKGIYGQLQTTGGRRLRRR